MKRVAQFESTGLSDFAARLGLTLHIVATDAAIPGSYWGAPEAGLIDSDLYVRPDTPIHSLLHEACHFACMDSDRRATLDTDAGGSDAEEEAVCYLQVALSDALPAYGRAQLFADMDEWGYSFRAGSAARWFAADAEGAYDWLSERGILRSTQSALAIELQ